MRREAVNGTPNGSSQAQSLQSIKDFVYTSPSVAVQAWRLLSLATCFFTCAICLHIQQILGAPLYLIHRAWYYSWQATVKRSAALLILCLNQWRAPARVRISGDASVEGRIRLAKNGKVVHDFPDRLVLISNHQIYTDWVFMWWTAYTAGHHGDLFIILKDSIKKIPIIGPGLMFFSFIFLQRNWESDRSRIQHRMSHLSSGRSPMWLLIFPEGTNMSTRAYAASKKWSAKSGTPDLELCLVPRTRGLQFCLQELTNSVEWVYDCTIAYDGIPKGEYGQEVFSLKRLYVEGRRAPLTHIHWRRYATKDIPIQDETVFSEWLTARWNEKEELLKLHQQHGQFPAYEGHLETDVGISHPAEAVQLLSGVLAAGTFWLILRSSLALFARTLRS